MIAVIDYGLGNLNSVSKALETLGAKTVVSSQPEKIAQAKAVILPGVGAFKRGMENLEKLNLIPVLRDAVRQDKPLLGICLGLQLLFSESQEHGLHKGLDIIKGRVVRFESALKVPHMGWNQVKLKNKQLKIFEGIPDESYFYFVHTYYVQPENKKIAVATTNYGQDFTSVVNKDNLWGVQFHPEKSAALGLKFLDNFLKLC